MSEEFNRRNYLRLNWKASVSFLGSIVTPYIEQERELFRPPGVGSELDFLTSCIRCGKCMEVCSEGIIRMLSSSSGAGNMNTPYLDPNVSPCTFCFKCIESCPTNALSFSNYEINPSLGKASIRKDGCIAHQNVMCDYCYRSCPVEGALKMEDGVPLVMEEFCNGCGICVAHCINESKGIWVYLNN